MLQNEFDISKIISKLIKKNFFYGYILIQIEKRKNINIPLASVTFTSKNILIEYNPVNLCLLPEQEQIAILEHEVRHITNGHLFQDIKGKNFELLNIAMDLAINPYITNMGKYVHFPKYYDLKDGLSNLEYYKLLQNKDISKIVQNIQINTHNFSNDNNEILKEEVKNMLTDACNMTKQAGYDISNISKEIKWIYSKNINWSKILRNRILEGSSPEDDYILTKQRISKRFNTVPSIKKNIINKDILIIIDVSGSIDELLLSKFFGEIIRLKPYINNVTIITFSVGITQTLKYKFDNKPVKLIQGGGTIINKEMVDILNNEYKKYYKVIFTDGCINFTNCTPENIINTDWVITDKNSYEYWINNATQKLRKSIIMFE